MLASSQVVCLQICSLYKRYIQNFIVRSTAVHASRSHQIRRLKANNIKNNQLNWFKWLKYRGLALGGLAMAYGVHIVGQVLGEQKRLWAQVKLRLSTATKFNIGSHNVIHIGSWPPKTWFFFINKTSSPGALPFRDAKFALRTLHRASNAAE